MDSVERITKAAFLAVSIADAAIESGCNRTYESKGRIQADLTASVFDRIMSEVPDALLEVEEE